MRRSAAIVLWLAAPVAGTAQSVGHDLENAAKDVIYVWIAPARLNTKAIPPLLGVLGTTGAFLLVDQPVSRWLQGREDFFPAVLVRPFREDEPLALLGRSYVLAGVSLVLYTLSWAVDSPDLKQAGLGCMSAAPATTLSRSVINRVVGRLRPRYGKGAFVVEFFGNHPWEMRSFPGGHMAHVMSCVTFWNRRFEMGVAEPGLYAIATLIGWARVVDGVHWSSDTVAGQALGFAVGKGIAGRYESGEQTNARVLSSPTLVLKVSIQF